MGRVRIDVLWNVACKKRSTDAFSELFPFAYIEHRNDGCETVSFCHASLVTLDVIDAMRGLGSKSFVGGRRYLPWQMRASCHYMSKRLRMTVE
jgi:hypothetical protein